MLQQTHLALDGATAKRYAHIGGVLYLIIIVIGLLGESYVRGTLMVSGDATASAQNILESKFLWRAGIAGQLLLLICALSLTHIWYLLLRPVHPHLSLLLVFFALCSLAVESISALCLQAVLLPLSGADYLQPFSTQQLHALSYIAVRLHGFAFGIALIFFGVECLIVGYLIRKSDYFPKVIGVLMQLAGIAYLINSFCIVLFPSITQYLFPAILLPAFIGESTFCLWLLIKGLNVAAWNKHPGVAN